MYNRKTSYFKVANFYVMENEGILRDYRGDHISGVFENLEQLNNTRWNFGALMKHPVSTWFKG